MKRGLIENSRKLIKSFRSPSTTTINTIRHCSGNASSRFNVLQDEDILLLPEDMRCRVEEVVEKSGFLPNIFRYLAPRPDEFRSFFNYHDVLMTREGPLTKAEREMIVVATSAINRCNYCLMAHGAILRVYAKNPLVGDQVAINHNHADITPRQKHMLDFAVEIAKGQPIEDSTIDDMKSKGFSEAEVWDIGAISAFFAMGNRLVNLSNMRPNDEFYLMGRVKR